MEKPLYLTNTVLPMPETIDLAGFAAFAAADELRDNWNRALGDGQRLASLLHDVDDVIERLHEWKNAAEKVATQTA